MADKKLSDVTSVEDFDYFLGVKSNGDVQKMSKDSMKKVISELMSSFLQINSPKNFIVSNPSNMETGIISIGDASREISKSEKLNEPSEDIPFIRGMDSNGNPIYIGTEQFSSVLAELMGGFIRRSQVSESFDSCINQGVYTINKSTFPSAINYPPGMVHGLLIVFSSANGWISQFAHNLENNTIHTRIRNERGSWTEWKQL